MGDRYYKISDDIKRCVEFKKADLLKDKYPTGCHLIVCRNVMIILQKKQTGYLQDFNRALVNDGCLFVGNTEQNYQSQGFGIHL